MDKMLDWIDDLLTRYLAVWLINREPRDMADRYFNQYKDDRDELDRVLLMIVKQQEHIKYYNYKVFMDRIAELTK
jgi:hypothetical protein